MVDGKQVSQFPDLMCIWYHDKDIQIDVLRQIKLYINKHFRYSHISNNIKDLMDYLDKEIVIRRIVFIICSLNNAEAKAIEGLVKEHSRCKGSYRLQLEHHASSTLPDLASVRSMIKALFDHIIDDLQKTEQLHPIEEDITEEVKNYIDESPSLFNTFKSISAQSSLCDLNKESLKFLLFQSLIEILIRKKYNPDDFKHLWCLCRQDYKKKPEEVKNIRRLEASYKPDKAIYYYTQSTCLFRLVNRAFRLKDIERIFRLGCYIADVYHQLEQLANNERENQNRNTKTFYRGKRFSTDVVQQFKDNVEHLISLNGLLSTSENYDISTVFSGLDDRNDDYQSVIFEINVNCTATNLIRPYANIHKFSANPDENEVLFFMGFVWKLKSMDPIPSKANAWHIVLESCTDYDPKLIQYIEESRQNCTYMTIGNILRELGDDANADNFYQRMREDKNLRGKTRGHLYFNMGMLAEDQGRYVDALRYFKKAKKFIKTTSTHSSKVPAPSRRLFAYDIAPSRMRIFNNLGRIYLKDGKYESAQKCFEDALRKPGTEIERATVLNNYGLLEFELGHNKQACDYINQAVQLARNDACSSEFKQNLDIIKHLYDM